MVGAGGGGASGAPRLPRRRFLGGAAAAVAVGGGAWLAACAGPLAGGPRPSGTHPPVVLTLQPNGTIAFNRTTVSLYQAALRPFYAKNPGVRVRVVQTLWGANVQAILGGTGADIVSDNYPPPYIAAGGDLLLDLDGYIKRDNVDVTRWSPGQIASYTAVAPDRRLHMLPGYFSPLVYAVRLQDFADAGVAPPDPAWTYQEFAAAAKRMTRVSGGKKRYGAVVEWFTDRIGEATWPFFAFGQGMLDASGRSVLSSPANVAAGQYLYEQLFWPGFAATRNQLGPWYGTPEFVDDLVTMQLSWDGLVLDNAQRYRGFQWDYYPPPVFPQGPTCMGTDDFYAIAATTRHPEAAWALLKFLTYDAGSSGWQHSLMKIGLLQPSLNALWDQWIATVQAVAPPLKAKNLQYFKEMAVSGRAFPEQFYPRVDEQCQNVAAPSIAALWARKLDVPTAFGRIDQTVNALLAKAATEDAAQLRTAGSLKAVHPGPTAVYPAPSPTGLGVGATPADQYLRVAAGAWTLLGDGTELGGTADTTTFACLAITASQGEWTCRLTGLANLTCPSLSPGLQVGLMVRGDLSDDAAMAALSLTGGHGIQWQYRAIPGVAPGAVAVHPALAGRPFGAVVHSVSAAGVQSLAAPLWLRLRRVGPTWTAAVSPNGKAWQDAGAPQTIRAGAVFLGIHCCAHNLDFGGRGYIRAVFDRLSFSPTLRVQVGDQGVPPAAGPVPAAWATLGAHARPGSAAAGGRAGTAKG